MRRSKVERNITGPDSIGRIGAPGKDNEDDDADADDVSFVFWSGGSEMECWVMDMDTQELGGVLGGWLFER